MCIFLGIYCSSWVITTHCRLYGNIPQILLQYKTWRYYNKFDFTKSLGVLNWCVKIPQCGYMEYGLTDTAFYVQKHTNTLHSCHNFPVGSREAARGARICETSLLAEYSKTIVARYVANSLKQRGIDYVITINNILAMFLCIFFHWHRHNLATLITLRPIQNGRHFADKIFKYTFMNENIWISINISLKVVLGVKLTIFNHWFR